MCSKPYSNYEGPCFVVLSRLFLYSRLCNQKARLGQVIYSDYRELSGAGACGGCCVTGLGVQGFGIRATRVWGLKGLCFG